MKTFYLFFQGCLLFCALLSCNNTAKNSPNAQTEKNSDTDIPTESQQSTPPKKTDASLLVNLIKDHQFDLVRQSCGELAHECFTEIDFNKFKSSHKEQTAVENIKKDPLFTTKVLPAIKILSVEEWLDLRSKAAKTRRPTWTEQDAINCNGQTDRGAEAETMIATAIIECVESQR